MRPLLLSVRIESVPPPVTKGPSFRPPDPLSDPIIITQPENLSPAPSDTLSHTSDRQSQKER